MSNCLRAHDQFCSRYDRIDQPPFAELLDDRRERPSGFGELPLGPFGVGVAPLDDASLVVLGSEDPALLDDGAPVAPLVGMPELPDVPPSRAPPSSSPRTGSRRPRTWPAG